MRKRRAWSLVRAEARPVEEGRGTRRADAIPIALSAIGASLGLALQPTPGAADVVQYSLTGSGSLAIPGSSYNVPTLAMQVEGLQKDLAASQDLGGFFTTPGYCLWAGACIPESKTGAKVTATLSGSAGLTLDASLKDSSLSYGLGASGSLLTGSTLDGKASLMIGQVTYNNQFSTTQLNAGIGAGVETSLSLSGTAQLCVATCTAQVSGTLFSFSAEKRDIIEVVTDGANKRLDLDVLGSKLFGVDSGTVGQTLYFVPEPGPGFQTVGGFQVGSLTATSDDDTTSANGSTHLSDSGKMPILTLAWNVIPFGEVGISCCGVAPIIGGTLTGASDELKLSLDLLRQDTLDVGLVDRVYFDEPVDLYSEGRFLSTVGAGNVINGRPGSAFQVTPAGGGSGTLNGHLQPLMFGTFQEQTSLTACGSFDITVGQAQLTLGGQNFNVGPLYDHNTDLGCLGAGLSLTDQSLEFSALGDVQDFQVTTSVPTPVPGSLVLLGLGVAALALSRQRKTG